MSDATAEPEAPEVESPQEAGGSGGDRRPKSARAVEMATREAVELWHDPDGEPYADVRRPSGARETMRVRSRRCRTWLSGLMYREEGVSLGGQAATDAVDLLTAIAIHDGQERQVHVRLARGEDGELYLDLGDETWKAVRIHAGGWELVSEPPVRFRRPRGLRSLPEPSRDSDGWAALRALLHEPADRDWILLVAWLVGTLHPSGPYPLLALTGEQGSAKTTVGRLLRSIVDPSEAPLRSPPREDRELVIAARNSHVLGLDNLSYVPSWLSDALCRIATGGGYSARELYTDGEEVVYSDRRPIILTSIEDVTTRGDLADRTLAVHLPRIPEEARRPEREIWAELDRIRPALLGALLDAASTALRRLPTVELDRLPRMADYAEWVVAAEPALPWTEGAFLGAYDEARGEMVETGIEADPVATALLEFLQERGGWEGSAQELLQALDGRRTDGSRSPKGWPETPRAMAGRVTRAAPLLRDAGWSYERGEGRDRRTIYLTPERHGGAADRHHRHDVHGSQSDAAPGRDGSRDGRSAGDGRTVTPSTDRHGDTSLNHATRDGRDGRDGPSQTRTTPGGEAPPWSEDQARCEDCGRPCEHSPSHAIQRCPPCAMRAGSGER